MQLDDVPAAGAPAGLPLVLTEAARVLRPGGHVLVGFQSGTGTRDVSAAHRRFGHEIRLQRHLHMPEQVAADLSLAVTLRGA